MAYQNIFKRYELKYLLTKSQKDRIVNEMKQYMKPDEYGKSTICNIYFDTSDHILIRRSLEKKVYKEKLRVRSYGPTHPTGEVFVELKKKYRSVVYKRRICLSEQEAMNYLCQREGLSIQNQITHEIDYACQFYQNIQPSMYIAYQREAFYGLNDHDLRITFDENVLWRDYDLSLQSDVYGEAILKDDLVLMEVKIAKAMPLWLTKLLSDNKLYKTSFSKYGNAYLNMLKQGGKQYV